MLRLEAGVVGNRLLALGGAAARNGVRQRSVSRERRRKPRSYHRRRFSATVLASMGLRNSIQGSLSAFWADAAYGSSVSAFLGRSPPRKPSSRRRRAGQTWSPASAIAPWT